MPSKIFQQHTHKKVTEHKDLSIILDSKLSFAAHIKSAISKTRKDIGLLKYLSKLLPRNTLNKSFKLYLRPHLDHGDIIYHISAKVCQFSQKITLAKLIEKLKSVQYLAALAITGMWRGTSRDKLYAELVWQSLNFRRWGRHLTMFYKIMNNLTPLYTKEPVPSRHQSNYSLPNENAIGRLRVRTEAFQFSFYPNYISECNKLDPESKSFYQYFAPLQNLSLVFMTPKAYHIFTK